MDDRIIEDDQEDLFSHDIIDSTITVSISTDEYKAFIILTAPRNGGRSMTLDDFLLKLNEFGVLVGHKNDALERLERQPLYKKAVLVAEAVPPINGRDASILYQFETTSDRRPKQLDDGTVDFKELGLIKNVRRGDTLCIKEPPTAGTDGVYVTGKPMPSKPGKDIPLPQGQNTLASPDGLRLVSAIDGQADLVNKKIFVHDVYEIRGDVDVSTGNIDFVGNVVVYGCVLSGYAVRAGGNIVVKGSVDGGVISAGGNVIIEEGYFGKLSGKIECMGDLFCKFVQNGEAFTETNFETEMCLNANIKCGGNAKIIGQKSTIISSKISARHSIDCVNVGTNAAAKSTLEVGSDPHIMERFKAIPKEQDEINKKLSDIERLVILFKKLEAANRLDEDKKKELEKLEASKKSLTNMIVKLHLERIEVEQRLVASGYGNVKIRGTAYPGTVIIIGTEVKNLNTSYKGMQFSRTADGIKIDSISNY